jgi:hypothetical protein
VVTANPERQEIYFWVSMSESYLKRKNEFRDEFVATLKTFSRHECK